MPVLVHQYIFCEYTNPGFYSISKSIVLCSEMQYSFDYVPMCITEQTFIK